MTLLYILDILREYSDENHLLTQQNIIDKLKAIYLIDIERKTISSTIDLLIEYGYDIIKNPSGGYYLNERDFNENEIKYLNDINPNELMKKLSKYKIDKMLIKVGIVMELKLPKTKNAKEKFSRIIEAADIEFYEKGFENTTIASITSRAGMAVGTFYLYFKDKLSLYHYILFDYQDRLKRYIQARIGNSVDRYEKEKLGLLILDVKGNFYKQVLEYAKLYNRLSDIIVIELIG